MILCIFLKLHSIMIKNDLKQKKSPTAIWAKSKYYTSASSYPAIVLPRTVVNNRGHPQLELFWIVAKTIGHTLANKTYADCLLQNLCCDRPFNVFCATPERSHLPRVSGVSQFVHDYARPTSAVIIVLPCANCPVQHAAR